MKRDLESLRDALWTQFEKAAEKQAGYERYDNPYSNQNEPSNNAIQGRQSIAQLGQAIINAEREIRERDESVNGVQLRGKTRRGLGE